MFNNVALNVVIGLVLIYLLYSFLLTIVGEMLSTWMSIRSRLLRVAIERMLNDGYFDDEGKEKYTGVWATIQTFFLKEYEEDFKNSFAGKLYDQPSIKYLSKDGKSTGLGVIPQTKPSYISDEYFANSFIQLLRQKGEGDSDAERIRFCLDFNTQDIQPDSLKNIRQLFTDAQGDDDIFKVKVKHWFNEMMDRNNGWYKRKLQFMLFWLGFLLALAFNVDSIAIVKILSKDKEARRQLVDMGVALSADSLKYKAFISHSGDSAKPQAVIDSGYSLVMSDIDKTNMILGLGWKDVLSLKRDSAEIRLDSSSLATDDMLSDASILKLHQQAKESIIHHLADVWRISNRLYRLKADSALVAITYKIDSTKILLKDSLSGIKKGIENYQDSLIFFNKVLRVDSVNLMTASKMKNDFIQQINKISSTKFIDIESIHHDSLTEGDKKLKEWIVPYGSRKFTTWEKFIYIIRQVNPLTIAFWGWVVTALMLSLGAPFWFDLLKKLVALRGAGVNPDEKKVSLINTVEKAVTTATTDNNTNPMLTRPTEQLAIENIIEQAYFIYGPQIMAIPGVRSVIKVYAKTNSPSSLEINVTDDQTKAIVVEKFGGMVISGVNIRFSVEVTGDPVTHVGNHGEISNKSGLNGRGALGCFLRDASNKSIHFMSCWHVLKGDLNYSFPDDFPTILDHNTDDFGQRWVGGIRSSFDYGIARCLPDKSVNPNVFLKNKLNINNDVKIIWKTISEDDIKTHIAVRYYDHLDDAVKSGIIHAHATQVEVFYRDKMRIVTDIILITNLVNGQKRPISVPGNSGSVVFDTGNAPIAMIIAGDDRFSYAVRLSNIFNLHKEFEIA
jgi:hypothetical protein